MRTAILFFLVALGGSSCQNPLTTDSRPASRPGCHDSIFPGTPRELMSLRWSTMCRGRPSSRE